MPRAFLKAREPFSSYSHFIGAVLSGAGLFVLLVRLLFDSSVKMCIRDSKRVETAGVYPLVRPRGVSALPAEVQRKTRRPSGANTLTQFVCPGQPVLKKSAARTEDVYKRQTCDRSEKEYGRGFFLPCFSQPVRSVR